ncbi:calmodulin-binding receptor-like cytoplasmic kinase 2, partial [Quercus suber]
GFSTRNFSPSFKIGQGGFGEVFRGRLKDGTKVAVKRAKKSVYDKHLEVEFQSEIQALAMVEHLNLVKFYGYLEQGDEKIVVLEYVPNGTLREHLDLWPYFHSLDSCQYSEPCCRLDIELMWPMPSPIFICIQVYTFGIYFERSNRIFCGSHADHPIIHRDIKSSNILLRENFRAKIADFAFATLAADNDSGVKGTAGYLDPEYLEPLSLLRKVMCFHLVCNWLN